MLSVLFLAFIYVSYSQTLCTKYSQALGVSNKVLVSNVVNGVVPKLVAVGTPTKQYFDGTRPAGSVNFLDPKNSGALTALVDSLVAFFGAGLGCMDGSIPAYTGASMDKVHQSMGISDFAFEYFNLQVIAVMRAAGVSEMDLATVLSVLVSFRTAIVQSSICDKYSFALKLSNNQLVTTVVTGVFGEITKPNTPTLKFFNGQQPQGSTNFLTNQAALKGLVNGLVTFFGAALGCSDGSIGNYQGGTLKQVHAGMGVTNDVFDFFNFAVIKVMRGAGVQQKDLTTVLGVLNGTRRDIVTA
jgi:truncated hemoglobin YjbI